MSELSFTEQLEYAQDQNELTKVQIPKMPERDNVYDLSKHVQNLGQVSALQIDNDEKKPLTHSVWTPPKHNG